MAQKLNPVVHFEMPYENRQRVTNFYQSVFNWVTQKMDSDMGDYIMVMTTESDKNGPVKPGAINGGLFPKSSESAPYPTVVISVDNIEEAMDKIITAGGHVIGEPVDIPNVGLYVPFVDTEGNRVTLLQPTRSLKK